MDELKKTYKYSIIAGVAIVAASAAMPRSVPRSDSEPASGRHGRCCPP